MDGHQEDVSIHTYIQTDEGWNSQKQLSGPVEKKRIKKEKCLYLHPKLSLGTLYIIMTIISYSINTVPTEHKDIYCT